MDLNLYILRRSSYLRAFETVLNQMLFGFPYMKFFLYKIRRVSFPKSVPGQNWRVSFGATRLSAQLKDRSSLFDFFAILSDDLSVRF